MPTLIGFVAAVYAAYMIYKLIPVPAAEDQAAVAHLLSHGEEKEKAPVLPMWRMLLLPFNQLATRLPPTIVGNTASQLYWAQFQGAWLGWSVVEFWGARLAAVLVGVVVGLWAFEGDPVLGFGLPALLYMYLGSKLNTPSQKAARQIQRELPEVAQTLALLIATGKSESEALEHVASGAGMINEWMRRTLARRPLDQPLFTDLQSTRIGHLRQEAETSGLPALINFATQLDFLKRAGIGADVLLGTLADTVASDYQTEVNVRAEALSDKLVIPVMLFYFIPYLVGLLSPMFITAGR